MTGSRTGSWTILPAVEQSIDSNKKPEFAAGTDPAYIPGLTAPVPARTEDDEKTGASAEAADGDAGVADGADDIQDAVPMDAAKPADVATENTENAEDAEDAEDTEDAVGGRTGEKSAGGSDEGDASDDGDRSGAPVFEVSDRRGSIRVDKSGIRFTLDDQQADFDWSEVSAVEVETARTARRFTLTVHVSSRRWFNGEVVAESRKQLKEWPEELDVVLDAYFEES